LLEFPNKFENIFLQMLTTFYRVENGRLFSPRSVHSLAEAAAKSLPIEAHAGIGFATGGDVGVPHPFLDGVLLIQCLRQGLQAVVLGGLKWAAVIAFEFDAD
jgi:hypothetical protein